VGLDRQCIRDAMCRSTIQKTTCVCSELFLTYGNDSFADASCSGTTDKCSYQSIVNMRRRRRMTGGPPRLGFASAMTNLFRTEPAFPFPACHVLPKVLRPFNLPPGAMKIHTGYVCSTESSLQCTEGSAYVVVSWPSHLVSAS
jgi:hypothetical protein